MKKNRSSADRISRLIFANVIGAMYFTNAIEGVGALILGILAIILLLTSFINFCPLYYFLGINSCKKNQNEFRR